MATWMEKDVLIEFISHVVAVTARDVDVDNKDVISHILGLTSKTVEFENPDRLSLIYKRDELYGLKPEDIEYQKEIKFIKDKQAILEGLNNG